MLPTIRNNKGSLIDPTFDDLFERVFYGWPALEEHSDILWTPRVDISETDKEVLLDVEIPGIDKKDIKIEVKDNVLYIYGERKQEKKTEESESWKVERHYGKFERSFGLPETVHADKVTAHYKDGILKLTLPKTEKAKPKEIKVEVG